MIAVDVMHIDGAEWTRTFKTMDEAVRYKEQVGTRGHYAQIRNILPEHLEPDREWLTA